LFATISCLRRASWGPWLAFLEGARQGRAASFARSAVNSDIDSHLKQYVSPKKEKGGYRTSIAQ
jgi:hypothetical protein